MNEINTKVDDNVQAQIAANNPWYTSDQFATQQEGDYRHNMKLRYDYARRVADELKIGFESKAIVDVGCGDGQWSLHAWQQRPARLIGIDYNPLRLERYQKHIPQAEVHQGSCLALPLENAVADVVLFHQVLEHIPEAGQALQQVRRILKPDGWLVMSVPNEGTWLKQGLQYRWIEPNALKISDHVNFYTRQSLAKILSHNGFRVIRLDRIGFYFPHNGISRRLIRHKPLFDLGLALAAVVPAFHDCLFAWCRPV